jgi:hypothetical protein
MPLGRDAQFQLREEISGCVTWEVIGLAGGQTQMPPPATAQRSRA